MDQWVSWVMSQIYFSFILCLVKSLYYIAGHKVFNI